MASVGESKRAADPTPPARLTIIAKVSDPGERLPNEDVCGHSASAAWVLDGATGLGDAPLLHGESDAAWLATACNTWLEQNADDLTRDLSRLIADLIEQIAAQFRSGCLRTAASPFELPSAGMALVRIRGDRLEYARLGDCRAIIRPADRGRVIVTGGSPLQQLDAEVVRDMEERRRLDPELSHAELRRAVRDKLRVNRARLNTEGGYWAVGIEPAAAQHMEVGFLPIPAEGATGLLVSDGFYRLVDTFGVHPDDAALLDASAASGPATLLADLRAIEERDPECIVHPRLKPKDDATALLFKAA